MWEIVSVWVQKSVYEWERKREIVRKSACVGAKECVWMGKRDGDSVCVCVCVCEKESGQKVMLTFSAVR